VAVFWSRSLAVRAVAAIGIGVMLFAMVYTGARGAALGFGALIIYLLIRDRHRVQLALFGGVLATITIIMRGPAYLQRWQDAPQSGGSGRISIWQVGWHAFQQNWLYGAGYGNFPYAYDRAFIGVFQSFYAEWHRASHNIILGYGVELGIIGIVLLLLAWWGQFRMLSGIPENDRRWPYRLALEGALIALFLSGMFADIMIQKYVWLAFMLVAFTYNASPQRVAQRANTAPAIEQKAAANA
jgi:O-antigen ligase